MPQTSLDISKASQLAVWIECEWSSSVTRYVSGTADVEIGGNVFTRCEGLMASIGRNHGGVEDVASSIKLRDIYEPFNTMALGYLHAPVKVTIGQVDPASPSTTARTLYVGSVTKITRNPGGQQRLIRVELAGTKAKLQIRLGYLMSPTCQHVFGDPNTCKATKVTVTGTVSAVRVAGNTEVEVAGTFSDLTERLWKRGFVEVDGARAMIRQVSAISGGAKFTLTRVPPDSWIGESITCESGCDKQPSTCEEIYDNIRHISAPGVSIPPYNPLVSIS